MTKRLFTLLLIALSFAGYSQGVQQPEKQDTPEVMYIKLKKLYIQMEDSKSHKIADSLFQVYIYKITPDMPLNEISKENNNYPEWTKANLSKTEFKNVAEAEKLWAEYEAANRACVLDNKEYTDYMIQVIQLDGGVDMYVRITEEVFMDNPKRNRIKLPNRQKKSDFYPKLPGQ
jgi:hypothetical protein